MRALLNLFQVISIWLWTIISAIFGFLLIPFFGQKVSIYVSSQVWSTFILAISGVKLVVEGLDNIDTNRHVIFVANHASSYDIPLMFKAIPVPLFFLAKAELQKIPVFGWYVGAVGMIFIERKNHEKAMDSLRKAGDEIKKGKNIISFPEGTRTRSGKMNMFKRGTFILALENNIDVVPVAIIGSRQINPPGYRIQSGKVIVRIGEPVSSSLFDKTTPDDMAKYFEDTVRQMLG